jgi:hypothetical protein
VLLIFDLRASVACLSGHRVARSLSGLAQYRDRLSNPARRNYRLYGEADIGAPSSNCASGEEIGRDAHPRTGPESFGKAEAFRPAYSDERPPFADKIVKRKDGDAVRLKCTMDFAQIDGCLSRRHMRKHAE